MTPSEYTNLLQWIDFFSNLRAFLIYDAVVVLLFLLYWLEFVGIPDLSRPRLKAWYSRGLTCLCMTVLPIVLILLTLSGFMYAMRP